MPTVDRTARRVRRSAAAGYAPTWTFDPGSSGTSGIVWTSNATTDSTTPVLMWQPTSYTVGTTATNLDQAIWRVLNDGWYDATNNAILNQWNQLAQENVYARTAREQAAMLAAALNEERNRTDPEYAARIELQRREHERANARAEQLLLEHLSPQQNEELRARGYFHLETIAASGERRRYRIRRGRHGNIDQVDDHGRVLKSLCVHPTLQCPDADTMLAQKLWLQCNEEQLLRTANHIAAR